MNDANQGNYSAENQYISQTTQGRFGEGVIPVSKDTWTCPVCETHNTGEVCILCGYTKTAKTTKHKKARIGIAVVVAAAFAVIVISAVVFNPNRTKYKQACEYLSQERFEEASSLFAELGDYKNSPTMVDETRYQKGMDYWRHKEYIKAYSVISKISTEYKDVSEKMSELKMEWAGYILNIASLNKVHQFINTVTLTEDESRELYELVTAMDSYDEITEFTVRVRILNALTGDIPGLDDVKELLNAFQEDEDAAIAHNSDLIRQYWNIPIIQSFVTHDWNLTVWLIGNWRTSSGDYLNFYYKDDDTETIWCDFNLPWVEEPPGTTGFDIVDRELIWINDNVIDYELAKVYRFEMIAPDTMDVYCYKDGVTYTLYR